MTDLRNNIYHLDSVNQALTLEIAELKKEREKFVELAMCSRRIKGHLDAIDDEMDEAEFEEVQAFFRALEPFEVKMWL